MQVVDRLTKATSFTGTHKFGAAVRASLDEDSHREWARSMHIQRRQREELRKRKRASVWSCVSVVGVGARVRARARARACVCVCVCVCVTGCVCVWTLCVFVKADCS